MRRAALFFLGFSCALAGCTPSATDADAGSPPAAAGPGVTFTYPRDGQLDVPVGVRVLAHFSDPVAASAATGQCTVADAGLDAGPVLTAGSYCLVGPQGVVPAGVSVHGTTLLLEPDAGLQDGTTYRLFAGPGLVAGATNLSTAPLATFTTRSVRPRGGQAPSVISFNDLPLATWTTLGRAIPFLDVESVRLVFSEPLDEATVTTDHLQLLEVAGTTQTPVPGTLLVKDVHVTFDPDATLDPAKHYLLRLTADLKDREGTALVAVDLPLRVARTGGPSGMYPQGLALTPAYAPTGQESVIGAMAVNSNTLRAPLVGFNQLGIGGPGLKAELGDPAAFGGPVPMLLRKGQVLDLTNLAIHYGGVLDSGLQTGPVRLTILTDALGFLSRSPWRPPEQVPDDKAPTFIDITMDMALTSTDALGNTLSSQTVPAVRLLGLSTTDVDQLAVDQVGALELSTLGVGEAAVALAIRLRTGATVGTHAVDPVTLTSTYPPQGEKAADLDDSLQLNFTGLVDSKLLRDGQELTLTRGTTHVPVVARTDGAAVLIQPQGPLVAGEQYTLKAVGLKALSGQAIDPITLTFSTAALAPTTVAPIVASVSIGAPCALQFGSATSGGVCGNSQPGTPAYLPFVMAAQREVRVHFSQPMRPQSMTLGTRCNTGSIRVERWQNGVCVEAVSGTLLKRSREARFVPSQAWVVGAQYQLRLVAGPDASCGADELCGALGRAVNTQPLTTQGTSSGGGPDIVVDFVGGPVTAQNDQPLASSVVADQNANGALDTGETLSDTNRVALEVAGTGGIVTEASLNGDDCLPARPGQQSCAALHAELPVVIGAALPVCPVDPNGHAGQGTTPCVQVRVLPNLILNTALSMNTTALYVAPINDLSTGTLVMRVMEPDGPSYGYIVRDPALPDPQFVINQTLMIDAPDLKILAGLVSHDMRSKRINVTLKGPITFLPDGRMHVALRNTTDLALQVNISALGFDGHIDLRIPAGEMPVTLNGPVLR